MNDTRSDTRHFTELALTWARSRQSSQTHYVHFYPHAEQDQHDAIPLVENGLFALALFQSRTIENVQEGKTILEALLHFQNRTLEVGAGNFPVYLHDYPFCKDKFVGLRLFPVFYWIYKNFSSVLGAELKQRLEQALALLVQHGLKLASECQLPFELSLRLSMALKAWGRLMSLVQLEQEGERLETKLLQEYLHSTPWSIYSPQTLAEMLVSLQLIYPSFKESSWSGFWEFLENTWHAPSCGYAGPSYKEYQKESEPEVTLYDQYASYFSDTRSKRSQKPNHSHLQAVLIRPTEDRFKRVQYPLFVHGRLFSGEKWHVEQQAQYALSVMEHLETSSLYDKGSLFLKVIWGDANHTYSWVCQARETQLASFQTGSQSVELFFEMNAPFDQDDREKSKEIAFFIDLADNPRATIDGLSSNTFQCGEGLEIRTDRICFRLQCEVVKGEGNFFGHLMRGNRPSQVAAKGAKRFDAFDMEIFLRALQRTTPCTVKVLLSGLYSSTI